MEDQDPPSMSTSANAQGNMTHVDEDKITMPLSEITGNAEATQMNDPIEEKSDQIPNMPPPTSTSMNHYNPFPLHLAFEYTDQMNKWSAKSQNIRKTRNVQASSHP